MVHKFAIRIKKYVAFQTPEKIDRNLNVFLGAKTRTSSAVISFPILTDSLDPLTGSSDPLKVSTIPMSIATLPSTFLQFPQDLDFLLSVLIVLCVTLCFFSRFSFWKDTHLKTWCLSLLLLSLFHSHYSFCFDPQMIQNWSLRSIFEPF